MPADDPSVTQSQTQTLSPRQSDYILFKRYAAYTFLVGSPLLIALPPRKLDLHTAALTAAFFFSANHITSERTGGRGITDHLAGFAAAAKPRAFRELPSDRAEEVQRQLKDRKMREQADRQESLNGKEASGGEGGNGWKVGEVAKGLWMGGETEDWRERRAREEKKALEEGKGYGDLIMEHIKDAWGVNNKGEGDGKDGDPESEKKQ